MNPATGVIQRAVLRHTTTREVARTRVQAMPRQRKARYLTVAFGRERGQSQELRPTGLREGSAKRALLSPMFPSRQRQFREPSNDFTGGS